MFCVEIKGIDKIFYGGIVLKRDMKKYSRMIIIGVVFLVISSVMSVTVDKYIILVQSAEDIFELSIGGMPALFDVINNIFFNGGIALIFGGFIPRVILKSERERSKERLSDILINCKKTLEDIFSVDDIILKDTGFLSEYINNIIELQIRNLRSLRSYLSKIHEDERLLDFFKEMQKEEIRVTLKNVDDRLISLESANKVFDIKGKENSIILDSFSSEKDREYNGIYNSFKNILEELNNQRQKEKL